MTYTFTACSNNPDQPTIEGEGDARNPETIWSQIQATLDTDAIDGLIADGTEYDVIVHWGSRVLDNILYARKVKPDIIIIICPHHHSHGHYHGHSHGHSHGGHGHHGGSGHSGGHHHGHHGHRR